MSQTTMRVAILALLFGLVGAYGFRSLLLDKQAPAQPRAIPRTTVPMAAVDLPGDRIIELGDIAMVSMTRQEMVKELPRLREVMLNPDQIIGRRLGTELAKGQPFLTSQLYLQGVGPDVSRRLADGFVAVSLQLPETRGGSVPVGAVVDVIFRVKPRGSSPGSPAIPETTMTLLEKVKVLDVRRPRAAGLSNRDILDVRSRLARVAPPPPTVILAVNSAQAIILKTVEDRGDMSLVIRRDDDRSNGDRERLTLEKLVGVQPLPVPFVTVISRRGSTKVNVFDRTAGRIRPGPKEKL